MDSWRTKNVSVVKAISGIDCLDLFSNSFPSIERIC